MAIDILHAFRQSPPPLDYVWPGLVSGTVGAVVGPGGAGKSFWALEAAMAVAAAPDGDLLDLRPAHSGRVVYLATEDPESVLIRRLHAIGQHLSSAAQESIAERLSLLPIMGMRVTITDNGRLEEIAQKCEGARLIILDTLSRLHNLDENSNGDMSSLVSIMEYIARRTGAALLYLHHVSKGSVRDGVADQQQAARGASALIDNARWCGNVSRMTEAESKKLYEIGDLEPIGAQRVHYVRFSVSKSNYDTPLEDQWFKRHPGGVLLPVELVTKKPGDYRAQQA